MITSQEKSFTYEEFLDTFFSIKSIEDDEELSPQDFGIRISRIALTPMEKVILKSEKKVLPEKHVKNESENDLT